MLELSICVRDKITGKERKISKEFESGHEMWSWYMSQNGKTPKEEKHDKSQRKNLAVSPT